MKIELMNMIKEVFYLVLIAVVPVLTAYAVKFISRGREALLSYIDVKDAEAENISLEKAKKYVDKAADMIEDIVLTVSQTYVEQQKKIGKFDEQAQLEAFSQAFNTTKMMLSDEMNEAIEELHKDVDSFISLKIESFVNKNKTSYLTEGTTEMVEEPEETVNTEE